MPQKTAFFDMDCTITAPIFHLENSTTPGFFKSNWPEFCNKEQTGAYKNCVPVEQVIKYAKYLQAAGWDVKLLTVVLSEGEKPAKITWLDDHNLQNLFSEVIFVNESSKKIPHIINYADTNGLALNDCMLIEDNYIAVLQAHTAGIQALHTCHIFAGIQDQLVKLA